MRPYVAGVFEVHPPEGGSGELPKHGRRNTLSVRYLMGLAFERLHSYEPALWSFGVFMLLASAVILCLGPYRYPVEDKTRVNGERAVDIPATERA